MDILDVFDEATKEASAFEDHPGRALPLDERLLYLQMQAMLMNVDGEIHPLEEEFLTMLLKSFGMEESTLSTLIDFADAPDKDSVKAFVTRFRRRPIAQLFVFDALWMLHRDDVVHERERLLLDKIGTQLEILEGTLGDINELFGHIKNKSWQEASVYFGLHRLNPDYFRHLLAYFEVDYDQLMQEASERGKTRLMEMLRSKSKPMVDALHWEVLTDDANKGKHVTRTPKVRLLSLLDHDTILPFLQSQIDRGAVRVSNNEVYKDDALYCDLSHINLGYDSSTRVVFPVSHPDEDADYADEDMPLLSDFFSLVWRESVDLGKNEHIDFILDALFSARIFVDKTREPSVGLGEGDVCLRKKAFVSTFVSIRSNTFSDPAGLFTDLLQGRSTRERGQEDRSSINVVKGGNVVLAK